MILAKPCQNQGRRPGQKVFRVLQAFVFSFLWASCRFGWRQARRWFEAVYRFGLPLKEQNSKPARVQKRGAGAEEHPTPLLFVPNPEYVSRKSLRSLHDYVIPGRKFF